MTERLSDKNPCNSCKADRQIGNPNRWECECSRCDKPNDWKNECVKKLAEYETAEKEGRMVVLLCKVGDTLFCFSRGEIYPFKVRCIRIYEERGEIELWYAGDEENLKFWHITIAEQDIGYKFFFAREGAEKALKEMERYMNKEVLKRRLREAETVRDNLLHQLADVVRKVDYYKKIIEDLEEERNEHHS